MWLYLFWEKMHPVETWLTYEVEEHTDNGTGRYQLHPVCIRVTFCKDLLKSAPFPNLSEKKKNKLIIAYFSIIHLLDDNHYKTNYKIYVQQTFDLDSINILFW